MGGRCWCRDLSAVYGYSRLDQKATIAEWPDLADTAGMIPRKGRSPIAEAGPSCHSFCCSERRISAGSQPEVLSGSIRNSWPIRNFRFSVQASGATSGSSEREINHVYPRQESVNYRPQDRLVDAPRNRDGQRRAKAHSRFDVAGRALHWSAAGRGGIHDRSRGRH